MAASMHAISDCLHFDFGELGNPRKQSVVLFALRERVGFDYDCSKSRDV
jgi:hypothetical protein